MADADRQDPVLNGATLLAGLQDLSLPPDQFDHRAHVCAAWQCLHEQPLEAATARFVGLIRAYVAHLGATDKYHHTLTVALLRVIRARMRVGEDWPAFAAANGELFSNARALLARHYSDARLRSDLARREFIAPNLLPL